MMNYRPTLPSSLTDALTGTAAVGESWPVKAMQLLAEAGVFGATIPRELGGSAGEFSMTAAYVDLAAADLTSCFVLTQQNSAVSRLLKSEHDDPRERWCPKIANGRTFATVGISHLTTSRQHVSEPAVRIEETPDGFRVDGVVPWSTSATRADMVLTGGTLDDGREVLLAIDKQSDGFEPAEPMPLLALSGSETGEIGLRNVAVPKDALVAGPVEGVMKSGTGGAGSLTTSALAAGLALRAIRLLIQEAERRPDVEATTRPLMTELDSLLDDLLSTAEEKPSAETIRTRANSLALRATQALMTASKGAGFVVGHPAERAVREAMFFLVWSCPKPVAEAAMQEFACRPFC